MERFLKGIYTVLTSLILLSVCLTTGAFAEETNTNSQIQAVVDNAQSSSEMKLVYQSSLMDSGWTPAVSTNEVTGQADTAVELNRFSVSIPQSLGNVKFRSHVANEGWEDWVEGTEYTGSENNPIQAIQVELEGDAAEKYDVYYRANVQTAGWLDWAKNGEVAGTTGLGENLQAIQVTYTEKDAAAPGATTCSSLEQAHLQEIADIDYQAHISNVGWQDMVNNGATAGTTGRNLDLEAVKVELPITDQLGDASAVIYNTQVENIGWMDEVSNGEVSGTTGRALQSEAVKIRLTGRAAAAYDVYYRIHSAYYGWLDWAKNGQEAGTTNLATAAQALQVELVPKGAEAPGETARTVVNPAYLQSRANVNYNTHCSGLGWLQGFSNGADAGTMGRKIAVEAFTVDMPQRTADSSVIYQAHVSDIGWMGAVSNGQEAGTTGQSKKLEAFNISLAGEDSYSFDIYYRAYCQDYGWLGWAKNGEWAGTTGGAKQVEAINVRVLPRNSAAPGPSDNHYVEIIRKEDWIWPLDGWTSLSSGFGARWGRMHQGIDIPASTGTPIKAVRSGTVTLCRYYGGYGNCVIITNDVTGEDVYYAHQSRFNTSVGAHVKQGEIIGFVGSTGNSTGPHLHLGIYDHGGFINPLDKYR